MTADKCIKHSSRSSVHPTDLEPLDINTLSNDHVIEELLQLPVGWNTVVIANSYWTKNFAQHFCLEHSQGSGIGG